MSDKEEIYLRTVTRNGNSLCVTIDKEVVKHLKLEAGSKVRVSIKMRCN